MRRRIIAVIFAGSLAAGIAVPVIASAATPAVAAAQPGMYYHD